MKKRARSIEQMLNDQITKWQSQNTQRGARKSALRPVITISRQPGSGGHEVARRLAADLHLDLFDRELIQKVAESAQMSAALVETLDEKWRSTLEDWLGDWADHHHLWIDDFQRHLLKVIRAIGEHGNAVIVGRGAHFILSCEECLRVRLIAPDAAKISNIAGEMKVGLEEAQKHMTTIEANQRAYIRKYFNADLSDPLHYDLVINTDKLSVDDAVETIKGALHSWQKKK